jgi:hypothetical protein
MLQDATADRIKSRQPLHMTYNWLFTRRRKAFFPRWFNEFIKGNLKMLIGQDLSATGEPEVVLRFASRETYGRWKTIGQVRYLDVPNLKLLIVESERAMRALLTTD